MGCVASRAMALSVAVQFGYIKKKIQRHEVNRIVNTYKGLYWLCYNATNVILEYQLNKRKSL